MSNAGSWPEKSADEPRVLPVTTGWTGWSEPRPGEGQSLGQVTWTILRYRWTVLAVLFLALGLTALGLLVWPPSYESHVLIQVEGRARTVPGFTEVSPLFDEESDTNAEMRIMRSRPLLQAVVDELGLDLLARPRTVPLVGAGLLRAHRGDGLARPPLGLTRYAWGGERIVVARLEVSPELLGEKLTLTVGDGGRYDLAAPRRGVLLQGEVGRRAAAAEGKPRAEILVTELVARAGTEFVVVKRSASDAVDDLQASLRIAEVGRPSDVVELSLSGPDPHRVAAVLNAVAGAFLRQRTERTSAEAARTLQFLESRLPALKNDMDRAEVALNRFRRERGATDLTAKSAAAFTRAGDVDRRISELEVEASELHQRYSDNHPAVLAAEERLRSLRAQRSAVDQRMRSLPDLELESVQLARASRLATELYLNVQNRAQDLRIVSAGWTGSVRVLEAAAPPTRPASPKRGVLAGLGLLLGLGAGIAAAFLRRTMEEGVEDPDEIEAGAGLPVLGAIPRSRAQRALERHLGSEVHEPLSAAAPGEVAVEELRNLRTSLQFAMDRANNNIVTLTSPAPRAGKSFVSVNLAHLFAAAGRRVVLVDADLRRGELHRHFGGAREPGLAEVLLGKAPLESAVRETEVARLSFLPAGSLPPDPAELVARPRMKEILDDLSRKHDVVLVDTPPVLSVTDSALVGRYAGINLLVLRAGEQTLREIAFTLRRLSRDGVVIRGAVLNDVRPSRGRYGRSGAYRLYSSPHARTD